MFCYVELTICLKQHEYIQIYDQYIIFIKSHIDIIGLHYMDTNW